MLSAMDIFFISLSFADPLAAKKDSTYDPDLAHIYLFPLANPICKSRFF